MAFTDARLNVPEPQVRVHRDQAPTDTTTAQAISAFGQLGGQLRLGQLEGNLEQNLADTGNIINTINAGPDAVREAVSSGNIDATTDKFKRIAASVNQGKISEQRATIEAEVELRKAINRAPGFADQFRKTANDILGFNPSGASLETLFMSGPDSTKLTQADKDRQAGQALFEAGFADTPEDGFRQVVGQRALAIEKDQLQGRIARAEVSAPKVAVKGGQYAQSEINSVMVRAMSEITNLGAVQDLETMENQILAAARNTINEVTGWMTEAQDVPYKEEAYQTVRDEVNRVAEANLELLRNKDILKLMTKRRDLIRVVMENEAINVAPELVLLNEAGGQAAVEKGMELWALALEDPKILEEMALINPQYRLVSEVMSSTADVKDVLKAIGSKDLAVDVRKGVVPKDVAEAAVTKDALDQSTGRGRDEDFNPTVKNLSDLEMPRMLISTAAKTPGSYGKADAESRQSVANAFKTNRAWVENNLVEALAGTRFALGFDNTQQKLVIVDRQGANISDFSTVTDDFSNPSPFSGITDMNRARQRGDLVSTAGIGTEALEILNEAMIPLLQKNGWQSAMGIEDKNSWVNNLVTTVNGNAVVLENKQARGQDPITAATSEALLQLDFDKQAAIRSAMEAGDMEDLVTQLEAAGMGKFRSNAQVSGPNLVSAGPGDMFMDTDTNQFLRINEDGSLSFIAKPSQEQPVSAGPGQAPEARASVEAPMSLVPEAVRPIAEDIADVASAEGIDPAFFLSLALSENDTLDPTRPTGILNEKGEPASSSIGQFQMTKPTFDTYLPGGDRFDPEDQRIAAANMINDLMRKFDGDMREVVIRWHDGQNSKGEPSESALALWDRVQRRMAGMAN